MPRKNTPDLFVCVNVLHVFIVSGFGGVKNNDNNFGSGIRKLWNQQIDDGDARRATHVMHCGC